jgi:hypothetical protein
VLKFGAVHLNDGARIAKQNFGGGSTMRVLPEPVGPGTAGCQLAALANSSPRRTPDTDPQRLYAFFLTDNFEPSAVLNSSVSVLRFLGRAEEFRDS